MGPNLETNLEKFSDVLLGWTKVVHWPTTVSATNQQSIVWMKMHWPSAVLHVVMNLYRTIKSITFHLHRINFDQSRLKNIPWHYHLQHWFAQCLWIKGVSPEMQRLQWNDGSSTLWHQAVRLLLIVARLAMLTIFDLRATARATANRVRCHFLIRKNQYPHTFCKILILGCARGQPQYIDQAFPAIKQSIRFCLGNNPDGNGCDQNHDCTTVGTAEICCPSAGVQSMVPKYQLLHEF